MGLALSPTGEFYLTPLGLWATEAALAVEGLRRLAPLLSRSEGDPGRLDLLLNDLVREAHTCTVTEMAHALPPALQVRAQAVGALVAWGGPFASTR